MEIVIHLGNLCVQEFFNGKELYKSINPDEAVAYGATIQAAILTSGKEERDRLYDLKVHDVNPQSVGLEIASGDMSVLIPRNNPIPANKEHIFTTSSNNQTSISIRLRACESGCFLSKYNLIDLPLYSRGIPKIHVTFSINIDGILSLKAYDITDGKKTEINCKEISCGLGKEEVEQLMQDLEKYKMDDEENLKRIEAKNALEDYAYRAREVARNARDAGKLYFTEKRKIERAVDQAINWLDNDQFAEACEFEEKLRELKQVCDPLIQKS
ncbi:70 kDa heat shock protein [Rhynchospora pubera]|uniref:70 kDa heat shock protein n=1 Tax=Rhynchospora pubera TaxID=906938 RepID=A0AAV8GYT1_9POAL|nr:70 kDa heat shock protein [Rhynchospora pubera]